MKNGAAGAKPRFMRPVRNGTTPPQARDSDVENLKTTRIANFCIASGLIYNFPAYARLRRTFRHTNGTQRRIKRHDSPIDKDTAFCKTTTRRERHDYSWLGGETAFEDSKPEIEMRL